MIPALPAVFSKPDGLTRFPAPLLPVPRRPRVSTIGGHAAGILWLFLISGRVW